MGEQKASPVTEAQRLRRDAQAAAERAKAYIARAEELERQSKEAGRHRRPWTREETKRNLRLIQGGAIVGAAYVVGRTLRKPSVAAAVSGTSALSVGAVALVLQPMPDVTRVPPQVQPPPATSAPEPEAHERAVSVFIDDDPDDEPEPEPTRAVESVPDTAAETIDVPVDPAPRAKTSTSPTPSVSSTPTAKASADVDVGSDDGLSPEAQLCLDVGLPPLADVGACLERAEKLGLDVDLGLGLLGK